VLSERSAGLTDFNTSGAQYLDRRTLSNPLDAIPFGHNSCYLPLKRPQRAEGNSSAVPDDSCTIARRWPEHFERGADLHRAHEWHVSWRKMAGGALLAAVTLYMVASAVRIYARRYYLFLPDYLRWTVTARGMPHSGPTHVFFLFVDHFEPDWSVGRTRRWVERYSSLASHHHDSTGRPLKHTWFYPGEQVATLPSLRCSGTLRFAGSEK
jgi:hypothetical protein